MVSKDAEFDGEFGKWIKKSNIKTFVGENTKLLEKAFHFHSKIAVFRNLLVWHKPQNGLIW